MDLIIIERSGLTAPRYLEGIFEEHVIPLAPFIGNNFCLMHDNAWSHVQGMSQSVPGRS